MSSTLCRVFAVLLFLDAMYPGPKCLSQSTIHIVADQGERQKPAEVSDLWRNKPIDIGVLGSGGFAVADKIDGGISRADATLNFVNAGVHVGKVVTRLPGTGAFSGQLEAAAEFLPLWIADYPKQPLVFRKSANAGNPHFFYTIHGVSLTPAIIRWNFSRKQRIVPWSQIGCGVLWTKQDFPLLKTSRVNFTPQAGFGTHMFVRPRQSVDFSLNVIHISNGNTADSNPGVNVTLQFGMGYTWWK